MKNFLLITLFYWVFSNVNIYSQTNDIYFARNNKVGVLVEDTNNDVKLILEDGSEDGVYAYYEYIKRLAKKLNPYKTGEMVFKTHHSEFERLTEFKIGDKLYLLTRNKISEAYVKGYYINYEDWTFDNFFYLIVDTWPPVIPSSEDQYSIATKNDIMNAIEYEEILYGNSYDNIKREIQNRLEGFKYLHDGSEWSEERFGKAGDPIVLTDTDYKIFKADNFYYAGIVKKVDYTEYLSGLFKLDKDGKIIDTIIDPEIGFGYLSYLLGIVDIDKDGTVEFIIERGYHEGACHFLLKYQNGKLIDMINAFCYGV